MEEKMASTEMLAAQLKEQVFRDTHGYEATRSGLCYLSEQHRTDSSFLGRSDHTSCAPFHFYASVFKVLRNACVQNTANQSLISNDETLALLTNVVELICDPRLRERDSYQACLKMFAQLLGNAVVNNRDAQTRVWKAMFPSSVFLLLSAMDSSCKDLLFMFVLNCLKSRKIASDDDEAALMKATISFCRDSVDAEWGLLLVEHYIGYHCVWCLQQLADDHALRLFLLGLIEDLISDDNGHSFAFQTDPLPYLSKLFQAQSSCASLLSSSDKDAAAQQSEFVVKLLDLLCTASSSPQRFPSLPVDSDLFSYVVEMLKSCPAPSPRAQMRSDTDASPVGDFKQALIVMIANMCYGGNQANQNAVRVLGGIEVILSSCHIDDRHPYIPQWSVFAIRNICEGNAENQAYISNLNIQSDMLRSAMNSSDDHASMSYKNGQLHIRPRSDESTAATSVATSVTTSVAMSKPD